MRSGNLVHPLALLFLASVAACGGSSSETPWPAEPVTPALGPEGERAPGSPTEMPEPTEDEQDREQPDGGP